MYKSIEAIEQLRNEKMNILNQVYAVKDIDEIYRRQTALNEMAIDIYTDASGVLLQSLPQDGVKKSLWSKISADLGQLNFIGIPRGEELKRKYYEAIREERNNPNDGYTIETDDTDIRPGKTILPKKRIIPLAEILTGLVAQSVAVPVIVKCAGASYITLAKVCTGNAALLAVEILTVLWRIKKNSKENERTFGEEFKSEFEDSKLGRKVISVFKKKVNQPKGELTKTEISEEQLQQMCIKAVKKVQQDNQKMLNDWFDHFRALTEQCIEQATEQA